METIFSYFFGFDRIYLSMYSRWQVNRILLPIFTSYIIDSVWRPVVCFFEFSNVNKFIYSNHHIIIKKTGEINVTKKKYSRKCCGNEVIIELENDLKGWLYRHTADFSKVWPEKSIQRTKRNSSLIFT